MKCVICTFTGKQVNPLNLKLEDICIEDIAHALALCNRFAGHTALPISVAHHSIMVSKLCEVGSQPEALQGLLHDASEAYLGDITKWLKHTPEMLAFREAENRAQTLIYEKFDCPKILYPNVELADRIMVRYEGKIGLGSNFVINHNNYPELTRSELSQIGNWDFISWEVAEIEFLKAFRRLT